MDNVRHYEIRYRDRAKNKDATTQISVRLVSFLTYLMTNIFDIFTFLLFLLFLSFKDVAFNIFGLPLASHLPQILAYMLIKV